MVELVAVGQTCRASVDVQCRQCGKERQRFRPEASPLVQPLGRHRLYMRIGAAPPLSKAEGANRQLRIRFGLSRSCSRQELPRSDCLGFLIGRDRLGLVFHAGGMPLQEVAEPALSTEPNVLLGTKAVGQAPRRQLTSS